MWVSEWMIKHQSILYMWMSFLSANKRAFILQSCLHTVHTVCMATYLGNNSLSCAVVFEEEVISLNEELAGILLFPCCSLPPQNDRTLGALLFQHTVYILYKNNRQDEAGRRWSGEDKVVWPNLLWLSPLSLLKKADILSWFVLILKKL